MRRKIYFVLLSLIMTTIMAAEMPLIVFAKKDKAEQSEDADEEAGDDEEQKEEEEKKRKSSSENQRKKSSSSEINAKIQENKDAMSNAQNSKNTLSSGMQQAKAIVAALNAEKNDLENYVTKLDKNLTEIQENIEELNGQIEEKNKEIDQTKIELSAAKESEEEQYEAMKQRIRFMYETKESSIIDVLFGANGIKDLLNRAEYIEKVAEYDRKELERLVDTKVEIAQKEALLETESKELKEKKEEVEEQEESVSTLIDAKETEISEYNSSIKSKEAEIQEYVNMIAAQDAQIKALESAIAAEMAALEELEKQAEENGEEFTSTRRKYDGGKFTFPAPSYTRISDDYGNRMHPTLGVEKFHNGIDLAAPSGSPILAAYDGTVIAADYSSTMGNYLMINHGDGLFTIYMHASSLLVSKGAEVSKGQKIATVGSTGRSTGPHLHFSVRVNGNYVSPWNYIK